ncbi:MAG: glycoside hydrolase family 5 protein [Sphingomicrobium sp.]
MAITQTFAFRWVRMLAAGLFGATLMTVCAPVHATQPAPSAQIQTAEDLDAWTVAKRMGVGINVGNTLDNNYIWETGWGNPPINRQYIRNLAALGFKTVRLPVAWDTYAHGGRIDAKKTDHVAEVVDWILEAGMYCVVNIHWDGGWIDSGDEKRFGKNYATFTPDAERKFKSYWAQIATRLADRNQRLVFEGLNEETNFERMGSEKKAYETLTRVNQMFIDTVRATGGNNARRPLIITGYKTDITKTTNGKYILPRDTVPHKLLLSVHYYSPWPFAGMTKDEVWGKARWDWGTKTDYAEQEALLDKMAAYSVKNDIPVFLGEFGVDVSKDPESRVRWMTDVAKGSLSRKMVPVMWEIGQEITRKPPWDISTPMAIVLTNLGMLPPAEPEAKAAAK